MCFLFQSSATYFPLSWSAQGLFIPPQSGKSQPLYISHFRGRLQCGHFNHSATYFPSFLLGYARLWRFWCLPQYPPSILFLPTTEDKTHCRNVGGPHQHLVNINCHLFSPPFYDRPGLGRLHQFLEALQGLAFSPAPTWDFPTGSANFTL